MKYFKPFLIIAFSLFAFASCDSAGVEENQQEDKEVYTAVEGLEDRITSFDKSTSSAAAKAKKTVPSLEITGHVATQSIGGNTTRAAHLDVFDGSTNLLYIGYKVFGSEYGGGIDILNVDGSNFQAATGNGANSLRVDGMDVQEVALRKNSDALFAAVGDEPEGFGNPSRFHSIDTNPANGLPGSSLSYEEIQLEGVIAKSVVASGNGSPEAYAISDEEAAYEISINNEFEINSVTEYTQGGLEFRSVTAFGNESYALTKDGSIYQVNGGLSQETSLSSVTEIQSIARMEGQKINGTKLLLVPLNDNGFRILDTSGNTTFSESEVFATSITASDDYIYVSTGDGLAVYEIESGITNGNPGEGLSDIGRVSITELPNASGVSFTDAQVNHIYVEENGTPDPDDDVLYVAKSTDGVLKIDQDAGGGTWD